MVKDLTFPFSWNAVVVKSFQEMNERFENNKEKFELMHYGKSDRIDTNSRDIASLKEENKSLKAENAKLKVDTDTIKKHLGL